MDPQAGLVWEQQYFGAAIPTWTVEPDVAILTQISRRALNIAEDEPCTVDFLDQETLNKVYIIHCADDYSYILRVSLPVHPRFKTMNEQATIQYVRHHTDNPAPQILAYDASNNNEGGFEWMVMDRMSGGALQPQFLNASWLKKEVIARNIIIYYSQVFKKRFNGLGSLFTSEDLHKLATNDIPSTMLLGEGFSTSDLGFCLSEIVSYPFLNDTHLHADVPCGPFKSSRDWLAARLQLHIWDIDNPRPSEPNSDSEKEDSEEEDPTSSHAIINSPAAIKARAQRLIDFCPNSSPTQKNQSSSSSTTTTSTPTTSSSTPATTSPLSSTGNASPLSLSG